MAKKNLSQKKSISKIKAIVSVLALATIAVFFLMQFSGNSPSVKGGKTVQGYTAFDFTKQGELTFITSDNKFLSKIDIEIADDSQKRETGLMYRDKMKMNQGMLFIFPTQEYQAFWMHNTQLPLDMIFVNKNSEIVTIHKDTTPFSDQTYPSTKPALYVVEVNAGYCDMNNISVGNKIVWRRN